MSNDKLEKVRALLKMTAADNPEEARAFAYQACKLIRECGFEVVAKEAEKPVQVSMPKPTPVRYPDPGPAVNHSAGRTPFRSTEQDLLDAMAQELQRTRRARSGMF